MQLTVRLSKSQLSIFNFNPVRESRFQPFSASFLLILLLCAGVSRVHAQDDEISTRKGSRIVDDTTKQIYGPNTSRYFYESDIFFNRERIHPIDTLIRNFHRFTYVQQNNNLYQDLGNIGTAIQPVGENAKTPGRRHASPVFSQPRPQNESEFLDCGSRKPRSC